MTNDILLIAGPEDHDADLVAAAIAAHPRRATVLLSPDAPTWTWNDVIAERERSDRLAGLIARIERSTGALVIGLLGDPAHVDTSGYDAVVGVHGARGLAVAA